MRQFKHKHDPELSAEKSHGHSTHYLILNKTRMVICRVPCEDIEDSKSWEEIIEIPEEEEEMTFELDFSQVDKFNKWSDEKGYVDAGTFGGAYTFCFTPTSIGMIAEVKCVDGTTLNITHEDEF